MGRLFGTDGVRGIANEELSPELAFKLGYYTASLLAKEKKDKVRMVVGKDTRLSGDMLTAALCSGICAAGADAYACGVIPTPAIAMITKNQSFDAGVVLSASHNPFEFNGIKFFSLKGHKLKDELEQEIEELILNDWKREDARPIHNKVGRIFQYETAKDEYIRFLTTAVGLDLTGLKIALDCAHGAAYEIAPKLFRSFGADIIVLGNTPNGQNINQGCGSTDLELLSKTVVDQGCDLGIAFDGDADRMLAVDSTGEQVSGDAIIAILSLYLKGKGYLNEDKVVVTVMSNLGFKKFAESTKLDLSITAVGDRNVLEEMEKQNATLGGEQSGHIIVRRYTTTGDGILSGLILLKALKFLKQPLDQAKTIMRVYPQVLLQAYVSNQYKDVVMGDPELTELTEEVKTTLGESGRVLVRPSGTEPMIRIMIEGEDKAEIENLAIKLVKCVSEIYERESLQ